MNILIFGGSFDPIHNAHLEIVKTTQQALEIDKTIIIPVKNVLYKQIDANEFDRFNMLKLAIQDMCETEISDYEINKSDINPSYTIDTINYYKTKFPNDKLYLLIGADQLINFEKWKDYELILKACHLVVYKRSNFEVDNIITKYNAQLIDGNLLEISSTQVKNSLMDNIGVNNDVFQYILNHGLYYKYWIPKYISPRRLDHSIRVGTYAKNIMNKYDIAKMDKAWIAGLYHDLAKEFKYNDLLLIAEKIKVNKFHPKIWHGPVAAWFLESIGLTDKEVLSAITRHTISDILSREISLLDKIIYCCDKLEPNRTDEDVNNINNYRQMLDKDVHECYDALVAYFKKVYIKS